MKNLLFSPHEILLTHHLWLFWKGLMRVKEDSWAEIISRCAINLIEDFGGCLAWG
jgi:hypothetical protein